MKGITMISWTELCQKNVDHYNNHPDAHMLMTVAYGAVAIVAVRIMAKKIATM